MGEEEASLLLLDRQIAELNDRIIALRTVILKLEQQADNIDNQYWLLSEMRRAHEALQGFRKRVSANLTKRH